MLFPGSLQVVSMKSPQRTSAQPVGNLPAACSAGTSPHSNSQGWRWRQGRERVVEGARHILGHIKAKPEQFFGGHWKICAWKTCKWCFTVNLDHDSLHYLQAASRLPPKLARQNVCPVPFRHGLGGTITLKALLRRLKFMPKKASLTRQKYK